MTIKVGDKLPAGTLQEFYEEPKDGCAIGPNPVNALGPKADSCMAWQWGGTFTSSAGIVLVA